MPTADVDLPSESARDEDRGQEGWRDFNPDAPRARLLALPRGVLGQRWPMSDGRPGDAMIHFHGRHRRQIDGSTLGKENCTPTSVAMGLGSVTGGRIDLSGGQLRALVTKEEEQNPDTPGWSLNDAKLGVSRVPGAPSFEIRMGKFSAVEAAHAAGLFIVLQGDSDQFGNATCSGVFDGDHCVGVHPETNSGQVVTWDLGDPICKDWRPERPEVLKAYAEKFAGGTTIRFGVFTTPVPKLEDVMVITKVKGEDWKPTVTNGQSNGVLRATPDRGAPLLTDATGAVIRLTGIVRTIAEIKAGGEDWRLTEHLDAPSYLLRSDWEPLVQGGDPAVDARLSKYIARADA